MENFVHVRQSQGETNVATIHAHKDNDAWIGNRLEVIRSMKQILQGNRIESPVAVEALVVKAMDRLEFLVQVLHVDRADRDVVPFLEPVDNLGDAGGWFRMQGNIPSVKCPDNAKAYGIVDPIVICRIPGHRDKGRSVITLRQHAAIIIDRGVVGTPHDGQALILEDLGGGIDQRLSYHGVVDKIKEAEETNRVLVVVVMGAVNDCRDAADGLPVAVSDQGSNLPMFFEKNRLRSNKTNNATGKRRREVRIRSVKNLRNRLELLQLRRAAAGQNRKRSGGGLVLCMLDHRRFLVLVQF